MARRPAPTPTRAAATKIAKAKTPKRTMHIAEYEAGKHGTVRRPLPAPELEAMHRRAAEERRTGHAAPAPRPAAPAKGKRRP